MTPLLLKILLVSKSCILSCFWRLFLGGVVLAFFFCAQIVVRTYELKWLQPSMTLELQALIASHLIWE